MTRLILHIGTHDEGSAKIQRVLNTNRGALLEQGILYPQACQEDGGHHLLARATGLGPESECDEPELRKQVDLLLCEIEKNRPSTVLLSSEELASARNLDTVADLLRGFSVEVVAFISKQDEFLEYAYCQQVQSFEQRYSESIHQWAFQFNVFTRYNYRLLTHRWEEAFGREAIKVIPWAIGRPHQAMMRSLLAQIQDPATLGLEHFDRSGFGGNKLLPAALVPYVCRLNCLSLNAREHRQLLKSLSEHITEPSAGRLLSAEEAAEFYEKFTKGNGVVFERYLGENRDVFSGLAAPEGGERYVAYDAVEAGLLLKALQEQQIAQPWLGLLKNQV